jgi:hypothetical protein
MQAEVSEFESLVGEACAQPLLADLWAATDMGAVCDSEQFFLFEEILRWVESWVQWFLSEPKLWWHTGTMLVLWLCT